MYGSVHYLIDRLKLKPEDLDKQLRQFGFLANAAGLTMIATHKTVGFLWSCLKCESENFHPVEPLPESEDSRAPLRKTCRACSSTVTNDSDQPVFHFGLGWSCGICGSENLSAICQAESSDVEALTPKKSRISPQTFFNDVRELRYFQRKLHCRSCNAPVEVANSPRSRPPLRGPYTRSVREPAAAVS